MTLRTCAIMGNGPSLNDMPADVLTKMDTFGVNYCPHQPTYYVCVDHDVLTNHHAEIYNLAAGAKIAFFAAKEAGSSDLYKIPDIWLVGRDTQYFRYEHYFTGLTVTYVCLKIAFYLGYERVHLYGVDHSPEWDHYRSDYPPGVKELRDQRMIEMEYHYRLAQSVYTVNGRRIINHSRNSKLDAIFPRK